MKKIILTVALIASGMVASAQVGIGNEDPKTTLHVTGANDGAALVESDGVTVPRVSTDMRDGQSAVDGVQLGQLVYSTSASSTGFWYWAGATEKWNPLMAAAAPAFSSVVLEKNSAYTALVGSELTGQINTIVFNATSPSAFALGDLTAADAGKVLNIYNTATNVGVSYNPAGDAPAASLTVIGGRGYSLVWTVNGWARTSY